MKGAILLLLAAFAAGCQGHDGKTLPTILDPAPFEASADGQIATDTDLAAVPVGIAVTVRWTTGGGVLFAWTLEPPPGSTAALSDPAAATPAFTPDREGVYLVRVRVERADGSVVTAELPVTAATYLGFAACAECHVVRAGDTLATAHARTAEENGAAFFSTPGCTTCHVLDPVPPPATPAPGGFEEIAAAAGFVPADFTGFDDLVASHPDVADRSFVQCESCHGPGSLHDGDPRRTAVTLRAGLCGRCHDGTVGPDRLGEWAASAHGRPPTPGALDDPACLRCHTAPGFLRDVAGLPPEEHRPGAPGVTCAVCHDPHRATNPSNSRLFGPEPLASGGTYDAGRAASCVRCHQSDVEDAAAHAAAGRRFPFAVQADMLAARGAVEFGSPTSFGTSFHGTTVFRLRPFTGNPEDPDFPDACVTCHMAVDPAGELGGHTMRQRDGSREFAEGNCDRCHPGLTTFDFRTGKDFDGDGVDRGVQTEVKGLLEIVFRAMQAIDAQDGITRPGGALSPVVVSPDLQRTTAQLRQAAYNYNFALEDGSFGVHNTTYAVQVLQRTYETLSGTPFKTAFPRAFVP